MQPPTRYVHVIGVPGKVKLRQLPFQARRMMGLNPRPTTGHEKCPQSLVAESLYHAASV
jgi:hypothetical protein